MATGDRIYLARKEHTHKQGEVDGLTGALEGKANKEHSHVQDDVTGLPDALAGKANKNHTHPQSDVIGLSDALAGKAGKTHSHVQTEVTGLPAALEGKANKEHTHEQSDVTGLTEALGGKAAADLSNVPNEKFAEKASAAGAGGTPIVQATSADGVAYIAATNGIKALTAGVEITIIPNKTSTSVSTTLNVNGLGAKAIRHSMAYDTSITVQPTKANWMVQGKPVTLMYDGEIWKTTAPRTNANDMYGAVKIENGGTGATTADAARDAIGAAPAYTYGTADLTAGTSPLETGKLYFVYEGG